MTKIHFIGIGGIGMSALAEICLARGGEVTGSDLRPNNLTEKLMRKGADISSGHDRLNISVDMDLVIRSFCIRDDNPELKRARELDIPVISRSEMLKEVLGEARVSIGVTGTHGKTTTSALVAHIMECCGMDPTAIIGGEVDSFNGNAKKGRDDLIVSEIDESDGFFRDIRVSHAIVTNIEREHMENYGSMEHLVKAYGQFISHIRSDGILVFNGEDRLLRNISSKARARRIDIGFRDSFRYSCRNTTFDRSIKFDLLKNGRSSGTVASSLMGRYNVTNILSAMALCMEMGLEFERSAEAVKSFKNVKRRFDLIGKIGSIEVFEDYAHHPTELRSVIEAARGYGRGRVITIFQPHRFSRTRDLAEDFLYCFHGSDILILTDIYSADEDPGEGIGIRDIYERIDSARFKLVDFMRKEEIPGFLTGIVQEKDTILVLGAGDIGDISRPLVEEIQKSGKGG